MTPFEKCQALKSELEGIAADYESSGYLLPDSRYCVLSEPVIDCESVIIALTGLSVVEGFDTTCGPPQLGTFIIAISRECAVPFDEDGLTNPAQAETIAELQGLDGDMLWLFASRHSPFVDKMPWSVGFVIMGGLMITSLQLTTGIG